MLLTDLLLLRFLIGRHMSTAVAWINAQYENTRVRPGGREDYVILRTRRQLNSTASDEQRWRRSSKRDGCRRGKEQKTLYTARWWRSGSAVAGRCVAVRPTGTTPDRAVSGHVYALLLAGYSAYREWWPDGRTIIVIIIILPLPRYMIRRRRRWVQWGPTAAQPPADRPFGGWGFSSGRPPPPPPQRARARVAPTERTARHWAPGM